MPRVSSPTRCRFSNPLDFNKKPQPGEFENSIVKSYLMKSMQERQQKKKFSAIGLIKRFGVAGFLFFLIKGLLWLAIPALAAYFAW